MPKMVLGIFLKAWSFTVKDVLPDKSFSKGQKLLENIKIEKFKCDILDNFQTMWVTMILNFAIVAKSQ